MSERTKSLEAAIFAAEQKRKKLLAIQKENVTNSHLMNKLLWLESKIQENSIDISTILQSYTKLDRISDRLYDIQEKLLLYKPKKSLLKRLFSF